MRSGSIEKVIMYIIIIIVLVVFFFPIYWVFITSFKTPAEALAYPPVYIPSQFTWTNYVEVFKIYGIKGFSNSLIIASCATLITLVLGFPAAYGAARYNRQGWAFWILSNRFFPPIAVVIPYFLLFNIVHLLDTHAAMIIVYTAFNLPLFTYMMVQFLKEIPEEIEQAALLDGYSRGGVLLKMILPLAVPGLLTMAILAFIFSWNEFLFAFILTRGAARTLPMEMSALWTTKGIWWWFLSALIMVTIIPVIVLVAFIQRYVIRGLSFGAVR